MGLTEVFSASFEPLGWNEDFDVVSVKYKSEIQHLICVIQERDLADVFSQFIFSYELEVNNHIVDFDQAVHLSTMEVFNDNPSAKLTVYLRKREQLGLTSNSVLFINIERFIEWFDLTRSSANLFF